MNAYWDEMERWLQNTVFIQYYASIRSQEKFLKITV